mmetsp:Transcript_12860/g.27137  ORF Transcript_12860/g.27137 Transcript_12860/m.27137 type:complete len:413 (-) Transcript_12860:396-1634(-)
MYEAPTPFFENNKNAVHLVNEAHARLNHGQRSTRPVPFALSRKSRVDTRRPLSPRSKSHPRPRRDADSAARQLFAEQPSTSQPSALVESAPLRVVKNAPQSQFNENALLTLKRLASGAFAGVVSRTAVAPLDVAKLKLMLQKDAGTGIIDVLRKTVQAEGVKGLFRGNGLNCCRVAPGKAIELCAYETIKALTGRSDLAGGAAGALNTVATYPLEVLRTRVALDPAAGKGGLVHSLKRIARKEGKSTFYRGCTFSVAGVIPYTAAQYLVYDALCKGFCRVMERADVPPLVTAVFGSVAVIAASAATFPLEVYRRQLQLAGGTNAVALAAMKTMVQRSGPLGLYRGLGASCLKMAPASGAYFMCYEVAKTALHIGMPVQPVRQPEAARPEVVDLSDDEFAISSESLDLEPQLV